MAIDYYLHYHTVLIGTELYDSVILEEDFCRHWTSLEGTAYRRDDAYIHFLLMVQVLHNLKFRRMVFIVHISQAIPLD